MTSVIYVIAIQTKTPRFREALSRRLIVVFFSMMLRNPQRVVLRFAFIGKQGLTGPPLGPESIGFGFIGIGIAGRDEQRADFAEVVQTTAETFSATSRTARP